MAESKGGPDEAVLASILTNPSTFDGDEPLDGHTEEILKHAVGMSDESVGKIVRAKCATMSRMAKAAIFDLFLECSSDATIGRSAKRPAAERLAKPGSAVIKHRSRAKK